MRFRKRLFTVLAILSLGWIVWGLSVTGGAVGTSSERADATYQQDSIERASATVGIGIGAGLSTAIFLCTGLPLLLLFSLLAWRNGVGLREKQRHEEMLAAVRHE